LTIFRGRFYPFLSNNFGLSQFGVLHLGHPRGVSSVLRASHSCPQRHPAKFGNGVRSKLEIATKNEVLAEWLCHNLCCVIQSMHAFGIHPALR
jgi:hypothetical protein